MNRRIYVTNFTWLLEVEQMLRNTGRIPDWGVVNATRVPGGWKVEWYQ